MLKTAVGVLAVFGTIFGGAYVLDRAVKYKEKMIEKQENDEVELDDVEPEEMDWYQLDLMEFMENEHHCCKDCKCDVDGDKPCCKGCNGCNYEDNEE